MGNFSGWLQRTENSAVNNALSRLVTARAVKNKDVLNSFSSLLGNCHLMGYSEHKKNILFLPIPVSLGKWEVSELSRGRFCARPSFSQLQFVSEHLSVVLQGRDRLSVLLVQQQSWGCAGWWHLEPSLSWHCCRSGHVLQSDAP